MSPEDGVQASDAALGGVRLRITVQQGLHQGASCVLPASGRVRLGSSADNDVVLLDDGVAGEALCMFERDGALAIDVLAPGASAGGDGLPLGTRVFGQRNVQLKVGDAVVQVALLGRAANELTAWPAAEALASAAAGAASGRQSNWAALTLAALSVAGALAVVGGAVNASARHGVPHDGRTLQAVVESFNGRGAQIEIDTELGGTPRLRGLVLDAPMRERLEHDMHAAGLRAQLQLHDARQMAESLTRLALLADRRCDARHLGGGRFECDAGIADSAALMRLRALGQQVPGVVAFEVRAQPPAQSNAALPLVIMPEPKAQPLHARAPVAPAVPASHPALPVIRHVAVGARESFAYDRLGHRLRVGDSVGGAKVLRIRFEGVEFVRDQQRYMVAVTPVLSAASR